MAEQWNAEVEKRLRESVDGYREGDTVDDQLLPCADVAAALAELDHRGAEIKWLRRERDATLNQSQAGARSELAADNMKLRASLASVSGALADAGTVKVPEDESKLGDAVRRLGMYLNSANRLNDQLRRQREYAMAALGRGTAAKTDGYTRAAVEFAEAEKAVIDECGDKNRYGVLCELSRARDAARDRFHGTQAARAGFLCSRCGKATDSTRQADDSDRPVCAACAQVARGKATIPLNQQDAPPAAQEPRWIDPAKGAASRLSCSKCGARVSYWKPVDLAAHERACWPAPAPAPQDASELALTEAVLNRLESRSRGPTCMDVQWTTLELPHEIAALVRAHRAREKEHVHSETKAPPAADTVDGGFDSRLRTDSAESTPGPGVSGAGHSHPAVPSAAEIAPEERAVLDAFKDTFVKSWFTGNFDTPEFRRAGIALGNWLAWAKRRAGEGVE